MGKKILLAVLSLSVMLLAGCASTYIPPGNRAELQSFAPPSIQAGFAIKPSNPFPASIAFVHIQSSGYSNYYAERHGGVYGSGSYSVMLNREVESPAQFERVSKLPRVSGLTALNRMLLPTVFNGDIDLRTAASRLQADLIFVYTFDTQFKDTNKAASLSVLTLGLAPSHVVVATSTVSGLLMDTRTGFIYSALEASDKQDMLATSWGSSDAVDEVRRTAEGAAFNKLIDEFVKSWPQVLARYDVSKEEVK